MCNLIRDLGNANEDYNEIALYTYLIGKDLKHFK